MRAILERHIAVCLVYSRYIFILHSTNLQQWKALAQGNHGGVQRSSLTSSHCSGRHNEAGKERRQAASFARTSWREQHAGAEMPQGESTGRQRRTAPTSPLHAASTPARAELATSWALHRARHRAPPATTDRQQRTAPSSPLCAAPTPTRVRLDANYALWRAHRRAPPQASSTQPQSHQKIAPSSPALHLACISTGHHPRMTQSHTFAFEERGYGFLARLSPPRQKA
jgi:hypothetical protein